MRSLLLTIFLLSIAFTGYNQKTHLVSFEEVADTAGIAKQDFRVTSIIFPKSGNDNRTAIYLKLDIAPLEPYSYWFNGKKYSSKELGSEVFRNVGVTGADFLVQIVKGDDTINIVYPLGSNPIKIDQIDTRFPLSRVYVLITGVSNLGFSGIAAVRKKAEAVSREETLAWRLAAMKEKEKREKEEAAATKAKKKAKDQSSLSPPSPPPPPPPPPAPDGAYGGGQTNPSAKKESVTTSLGGSNRISAQKQNDPVTEELSKATMNVERSPFLAALTKQFLAWMKWLD